MRSGAYSIIISRDGYKSKKILLALATIKKESTNLSKIYLAKIPGALVNAEIQHATPLFVKVDNGIYEGFTPLKTELTRKGKHKLTLNKKKNSFCYVSLRNFGPNDKAYIKVSKLSSGKYICKS